MKFTTEDERKFYWEQGYLIIEGFLGVSRASAVNQILRKVATEDFSIMLHLDRSDDLLRQSPDSDPDDRAEVSKEIRKIQLNERMVGIVEELYDREMVVVQSIIIYKEAGKPFADQAWNPHQDNSYAQSPNGMYLAVGYPLSDFSPENGGLYLYPGSHKEGLFAWENVEGANQKYGESAGNSLAVPDKYKKVDIRLKQGDVVIFHGDLIHGSYPNNSVQSRPFLIVNYIPYGESFTPGRTSNRRVIRCH
ncbi:phytanoyl-CoA dioxygenase family protein [Nitrospinae bacterium]|nr:phytanoyl-CoA dioxygenase family protein [Nitrospinota bacterium]